MQLTENVMYKLDILEEATSKQVQAKAMVDEVINIGFEFGYVQCSDIHNQQLKQKCNSVFKALKKKLGTKIYNLLYVGESSFYIEDIYDSYIDLGERDLHKNLSDAKEKNILLNHMRNTRQYDVWVKIVSKEI